MLKQNQVQSFPATVRFLPFRPRFRHFLTCRQCYYPFYFRGAGIRQHLYFLKQLDCGVHRFRHPYPVQQLSFRCRCQDHRVCRLRVIRWNPRGQQSVPYH